MTNQMTKCFDTEKEASLITQRLGVIGLIPLAELTDEVRAEQLTLRQRAPVVQGELQAARDEQRAAQEQGVTLGTAGTELRALTKRANLGGVFTAAMAGSPTDGAEAEIQKHYGLASNQVPIEMLRIDQGVESRAAASVPSAIGDATQAEVILPVFASGDGAFLGVESPDRRCRCCKLPDVVLEAVRPWPV